LNPLVTVITPAFNRAEYITEAVESVLSQSYPHVQLVVVDDGSSDGTFEILQKFEAEQKLELLSHANRQNKGQSSALNLGLRAAKGEYIVILDSDDYLHKDKIRDQVAYLETHPEFGMVYGQAMAVSENGQHLFPLPPDNHQETGDPNDLLLDCYMALPGGAMVRSKVFQQAGFFEERFRAGQDHDMILRIAEIAPYKFLKGIVFFYRKHEESISKTGLERRWKAGFEILNRAKARYPYRRSVLRKRLALLHFRMAQVRWKQGRFLLASAHLLRAGIGDPKRSLDVIRGREAIT